MLTVPSEEELIEKIISSDPVFNNSFNNYVRRLKIPYYEKISLVKSGGHFFPYPCDSRCPYPNGPRIEIQKRMVDDDISSPLIRASDNREDERCFEKCFLPIDVKYLEKGKIVNEYKEVRNSNLKIIDVKEHPENILAYAVISKDLLESQDSRIKEILEKAKKRPTIPQDLLYLLELSDKQPLLLPGLASQ